MKSIKLIKLSTLAAGFIISVIALSFTSRPGGEGFEIFLDSKVVMQRFGKDINTVQPLHLSSQNAASQFSIRYHHCGKAGKNRVVTILDAQNNLLKEWKFADSHEASAPMNFSVKEILMFQQGNRAQKINLFYRSSELPGGRQLVSLLLPEKNITAP